MAFEYLVNSRVGMCGTLKFYEGRPDRTSGGNDIEKSHHLEVKPTQDTALKTLIYRTVASLE